MKTDVFVTAAAAAWFENGQLEGFPGENGGVEKIDPAGKVPPAELGRMDSEGILLAAAGQTAAEQARLEPAEMTEKTGVVIGATPHKKESFNDYLASNKRNRQNRPVLFANTFTDSAAVSLAVGKKCRGSYFHLSGSETAGVQAIILGWETIRSGREKTVFAGGLQGSGPNRGAYVLVLESEASAAGREIRPLVKIHAGITAFDPKNVSREGPSETLITSTYQKAFKTAGCLPTALKTVFLQTGCGKKEKDVFAKIAGQKVETVNITEALSPVPAGIAKVLSQAAAKKNSLLHPRPSNELKADTTESYNNTTLNAYHAAGRSGQLAVILFSYLPGPPA